MTENQDLREEIHAINDRVTEMEHALQDAVTAMSQKVSQMSDLITALTADTAGRAHTQEVDQKRHQNEVLTALDTLTETVSRIAQEQDAQAGTDLVSVSHRLSQLQAEVQTIGHRMAEVQEKVERSTPALAPLEQE